MNPDDLARILDELGRRIGPAGEYVFALAVRQAIVTSAIGLFCAALVLVACIVGLALAYRRDSFEGATFCCVVGLLAFVVGAFGFLPSLLTPEYAAIQTILLTIGGAR